MRDNVRYQVFGKVEGRAVKHMIRANGKRAALAKFQGAYLGNRVEGVTILNPAEVAEVDAMDAARAANLKAAQKAAKVAA